MLCVCVLCVCCTCSCVADPHEPPMPHRKGSTGSIVSTISETSIPPVAATEEHSLSVEEVLELFLITLIHLDHRRGQEPLPDTDTSSSKVKWVVPNVLHIHLY